MVAAEAVVEDAHDPEADVETDEVGELERAHRVVEPDPRPGVDVLGGAEALLEGAHRLGQERHQDPVDDEPRPVGRDDDLLAERARRARGSPLRSSSSVSRPRISSMSGMTGTGLKKCIPTNRSRRSGETASASRWIAIDDVFEAKIAAAGASASSSRHRADLTREVLEDRLDRRGRRRRRARGRRSARRGRASRRAPPGVEAALGDGAIEVAGDPVPAGLGAGQIRLVEDDRQADRGVDLGDPVAHQPGARDEDALDRHRPSLQGRRPEVVTPSVARSADRRGSGCRSARRAHRRR